MAAAAALAQFSGVLVQRRVHVFLRDREGPEWAIEAVRKEPGPVFFTLVDLVLSETPKGRCEALEIKAVDRLAPMLRGL